MKVFWPEQLLTTTGKTKCSWPSWPVSASVMDGSVPLIHSPQFLSVKSQEYASASADCMRCSPMSEHANSVITGHHFLQC